MAAPRNVRSRFGFRAQCFKVRPGNPNHASANQGCGIRKCATTVRSRITGTATTAHRDRPPSHGFALGRSNSPTTRVASSTESMPALISDARTGSSCGAHAAGRLAAQAQPGRNGCAIQSASKPKRTTQAANTGERVVPCVLMGMQPDYRSGTPIARRPRRRHQRAVRSGAQQKHSSRISSLRMTHAK